MKPKNKEPCPCGSGARFKNCCKGLSRRRREARRKRSRPPDSDTITVATREGLWVYQYDPANPVHFEEHGGERVHRPHPYLELQFRQDLMAHLRAQGFASGRRHGAEANSLLQAMHDYCRSRCAQDVEEVASRSLVEFCFEQLDIWARIEKAPPVELDPEDRLEILKKAPVARLALQYLLEVSTQFRAQEQTRAPDDRIFRRTDLALIAAEYLVNLSAYSTMAYAVLPQHTYAEIRLEGAGDWLDLGTEEPVRSRMNDFMDARARWSGDDYADTYAPGRLEAIPEYLNEPFQAAHGISFGELVGSLRVLNDSVRRPEKGFDVPFVLRETCIEALRKNAGLSSEHAELALAGVVLTAEALDREPREMWRPKQASRVLRRAFLQLPHEIGTHLAWRREELERTLSYLLQEACFRKLPVEWMTPRVERALTNLASAFDREWEVEVAAALEERGLRCLRSVLKVVSDVGDVLRLDAKGLPGEIDVLAVAESPARIVVVEVKRTQPSYSPAHFRDDKSKFIDGRKSYCRKHAAKVKWVAENVELVRQHLQRSGITTAATEVEGIMVTKYESFANVLSPPYPVVSLGRLLRHHEEHGDWLFGSLEPSAGG